MTTTIPAPAGAAPATPIDTLKELLHTQKQLLKELRAAMRSSKTRRNASYLKPIEGELGRGLEEVFEQALVELADEIQDVLNNTTEFVTGLAPDANPLAVMSAINQTQTYVQVATPLIDEIESIAKNVVAVADNLLAQGVITEVREELRAPEEKVAAFERGLKSAARMLPGLLRGLTAKPAAPTNVSATAEIGWATVTWTPPPPGTGSPITGYVVTAKGPTPNQIVVGPTATTAIFDHLEGGTYAFTVVARNTFSQSDPQASGALSVRSAPRPPKNLAAKTAAGQVTLQWEKPDSNGGSPITSYTITYYDASVPQRTVTATAAANATHLTIPSLTGGRSYFFEIAAISEVGVSQPIVTSAVIPAGYTDYPSPQDLVRDSEAVATAPHLSDQQMIEHLRGVGKAFERFSREDLSLTDDQFEMLTANWGKALERLASGRPGGAAGVTSRSEVAAALQLQQMLNKGYEYVAGSYNASRPFDFGDLL